MSIKYDKLKLLCSPVCNGVLTAKPGGTSGVATVLPAGNKITLLISSVKY